MKTINEIRIDNAKALRDSSGGNSQFAYRLDRAPTQISRLIGPSPTKKIGNSLARHIEACFQLPEGWLDRDHGAMIDESKRQVLPIEKSVRYVPVISWVQAGAWTESEAVDLTTGGFEEYPCPVPCGANTYILRVVGESMSPEYNPGDMVFVDPEISPVSGDDVIAIMTDTGETTFKRYITDGYTKALKALNPDWPKPFIEIGGNCAILGIIIFSGKPRKNR